MATIALAAVAASIQGSAAFVAFTTAALGALGGIIDNAFVFPAIFGRPDSGTIEGPRLSSLSPQDGSEGVPINFCIGARNRVGGNVIWITDLEEVEVVSGGGGGGKGGGSGGGGQSKTYEYYVSAMIAICEGPIEGIVKAYADGKIFLADISPGTLALTRTVSVTDMIKFEVGFADSHSGPIQLYKLGAGDSFWTDLGFNGVDPLTISGYSNSNNNGTKEVKNKRVRPDGNDSLTLKASAGSTTQDESVTVSQSSNRHPPDVDRVALYAGGAADSIDPLVEADLGAGNTPRFKKVAKMVIERLSLANYGNRLPQFNFVVNKQDATTVREAIESIMTRGGFSPSDYDVTGIDNTYEIEGYSISGAKSISAMLEPIMLVWNLAVYENNGVLTFYERGNETTISDVRDEDWTAHAHGAEPDQRAIINEKPTFDLPSEVSISYFDSSNKDQSGETRARRISYVSDIAEAIRVPIWMSAGRARVVAETRLWRAWNDKRTAQFTLPPRYLALTEGDIVPIEISGETYPVRLTRISRGANYLLQCEGIVQDNDEFDFSDDGLTFDDDGGGTTQEGNLLLFIFNAPPLSDEHATTPGYYWSFALMSYDADFTGGVLYKATSAAGTYSSVGGSGESVLVAMETQLASVDNPNIFDEENTLDVEVLNGTLSSVSEDDLLNGANLLAMSNGEIIAFQTATSIGTNRYRLSKLLRGRRGTERFVADHPSSGEIGCVLDSTINFESHNLSDIDLTNYFKPVAGGQVVDDIDAEAFTFAGCTVKPFPVVNVEASRDASNNVTLTWDRRSRALYRVITATLSTPLIDGVEKYEVDLLDPSGTNVESSYAGLTSPSASISDADIVAAGYTTGDPVRVRVYQVSPSVGRGIVQEVTV